MRASVGMQACVPHACVSAAPAQGHGRLVPMPPGGRGHAGRRSARRPRWWPWSQSQRPSRPRLGAGDPARATSGGAVAFSRGAGTPGSGQAPNIKPGASFPETQRSGWREDQRRGSGVRPGAAPRVQDPAASTSGLCPHPPRTQQPRPGWPLASAEAPPVTLTSMWGGQTPRRLKEHLPPARGTPGGGCPRTTA